jgi:hypothetical protein
VRALMGPYLIFMASTVNGYEGTGRSLSLKLIQQLRTASVSAGRPSGHQQQGRGGGAGTPPGWGKLKPGSTWLVHTQRPALQAVAVSLALGSGPSRRSPWSSPSGMPLGMAWRRG